MSLKHLRDYVQGLPGRRWEFLKAFDALEVGYIAPRKINSIVPSTEPRFYMVLRTPEQEYQEEVDEAAALVFAEETIVHMTWLQNLLKQED